MLFITAKIQGRYYDDTVKEVKILSIDFLHDIREKYLEKLTLKIKLEQLDEHLVNRLHELASSEKGNASLNVEIADAKDKYMVDMFSTTYKINVNNDWIKALDELNLKYKVN